MANEDKAFATRVVHAGQKTDPSTGAIMTYASVPLETRQALGIHDNLIRLSVGFEDVNDQINDLAQALG